MKIPSNIPENDRELAKIFTIIAEDFSHSINQHLNTLRITATGLEMLLDEGEIEQKTIKHRLKRILHGISRINDITTSLRHLSMRGTVTSVNTTSVNNIIQRTLSTNAPRLDPEEIKVQLDIKQNLSAAKADPIQLGQVVKHLLLNVTMELERCTCLDKVIRISLREDAAQIILIVENTSANMTEVRAQLSDPLSTTKNEEKKTDFGLAIAQALVTFWGGKLTAETNPCGGIAYKVSMRAVSE